MILVTEFERGYLECALWVNDPSPGRGEYKAPGLEQIPKEVFQTMMLECSDFLSGLSEELREEVDRDPYRAGMDFFLTREGHGAGFWDGYWTHGKELTAQAKTYGSTNLMSRDLGFKKEKWK